MDPPPIFPEYGVAKERDPRETWCRTEAQHLARSHGSHAEQHANPSVETAGRAPAMPRWAERLYAKEVGEHSTQDRPQWLSRSQALSPTRRKGLFERSGRRFGFGRHAGVVASELGAHLADNANNAPPPPPAPDLGYSVARREAIWRGGDQGNGGAEAVAPALRSVEPRFASVASARSPSRVHYAGMLFADGTGGRAAGMAHRGALSHGRRPRRSRCRAWATAWQRGPRTRGRSRRRRRGT